MSWFKNTQNTSYVRNFCSNVLKAGEIPRHVAIIMDGNRRFARKVHCERSKGHEKGFEKLTEVEMIIYCRVITLNNTSVITFRVDMKFYIMQN